MRIVGTGTAPEGQYPKGVMGDAAPDVAQGLIDSGWVEAVPEQEDPARSRLEMANAAVRGENPIDPVERALADEWFGIGDHPERGKDPYPAVHAQDPDAPARMIDNTDVSSQTDEERLAPSGDGSPSGSGAQE